MSTVTETVYIIVDDRGKHILIKLTRGEMNLIFQVNLLSEHVTPKYPSLQIQTKVSTLTSTHVAPLLHGELSQAVHGARR